MPAVVLGSMRHERRKHPYPKYVRKRSNATRLDKLPGINLSETNSRILTLIQAASDGRKKATVLPPLPIEREPTFQRQPRTLQSLQCNPEEAAESHWQLQSKKVSMDVDKRIVTHLRKKMNKRLQQRLNALDPSADEASIHDGQEWSNTKKPGSVKTNRNLENELFNKYSDTGEKLSGKIPHRKPSYKKPKSTQNGHHVNGHINGHHVVSDIDNNGNVERDCNSKEEIIRTDSKTPSSSKEVRIKRVPSVTINIGDVPKQSENDPKADIKIKKDDSVKNESANKKSKSENDSAKNGEEKTSTQAEGSETNEAEDDGSDEDEEELFDLTRLKTQLGESPEEEEIESFRKLSVSPVQTPCVLRPITRGESRYALGDRMTDILKGHVHRMCQPESQVIKMYVSSGFTDTLAEKTAFLEKVNLDLRAFCSSRGYELEMYDLHWGLKDTITDDHSFPDTCLSTLNKCLDSNPGLNMLVLLGDKYGPYILPPKIPVDEFQSFYDFVQDYRQGEIDIIKEKIEEINFARAERERLRHDAESVITDTTDDSGDKHSTKRAGSGNTSPLKLRRHEADLAKAEAQTIKHLQEQESALPDPEILKEWYSLDENCFPPVYRLDNISTHYKEFTRGDSKKREAAKISFVEVAKKIRRIFDEFTPLVIQDPFAKKKYFSTMLGLEIEHGILETDAADNHSIVIQRAITDMRRHVSDSAATEFVDMSIEEEHTVDRSLSGTLTELKTETLPAKVGVANILPYDVEWVAGGINVGGHRSHQSYIERMCKQLTDTMKRRMAVSFDENKRKVDSKIKLFDEVSQHVSFCHERAKHFQGRKELLQLVKSYLRSKCPSPLVLYGKAGCGKTAVLCKTAKETHKWFKGQRISVLLRSIGITASSKNIRSLLRDLCLQMCHVFGNNEDEVPTDYKGLMNDFNRRMAQATPDNPIVIILDSLDRLSDDHDGRKMTWLPKELPKNAYVIVSTNPEEKYECYQNLKKVISDTSETYIEIPELPEQDAITIVEHWLNQQDRTFTDEQFECLVDAFKKCPMPLFLKVAFYDSMSWTSLTPLDQIKFGENVKKHALLKFGKLETKHGEALVRRALGYITAARNGVTNNEIVDILSLDDAVMDEVMAVYRPPRRRFPLFLWIRLRDDLDEYIMEIKSHSMRTWQWAHAQFKEAAEERYLNARDKAPSYHKAMAEYFLGTWAAKMKPYPGNDKGMLRLVSAEPLYFEPEESIMDGSDRVYNLRRVNELPHHLLNSSQMELYKSKGLCNFEWVLAKLCGTSLRALVEEYQIGLQVEPSDIDLKTLSDTIQLSAKALTNDPRQLASQMIGRLHGMIARDIPATAGDPPRYPYLHAFYEQAKSPSLLTLIPSITCLSEPGGILFDLLSGHSEPITAMTLTTEGMKALTASADNSIKLWDIRTGRVMKTIDGTGTNVKSIITALNNTYLATVEGSVIRVWNIRFSECVMTIDHYLDPPVLGTAAEGKYLVALFDGINIMRTWNLKKQIMPMVCEAKIEDNSVYKDNSILIAPSSFDDKVLHAFRGANMATVQHARKGTVIHTLKCNEKSSSAVSLGITRDYFIVACRQQYMTLHEIHQLELFDLKKGNYLRSVRGCTHDNLTSLHLNYMGSHAIAVCYSEKTETSDIAIWNLETEDHKHLARHAGVSLLGACVDFKYCLTAAKGDKTLRIWNLSGKVNQSTPKLKKNLGVTQIIPMTDNQRYVVARQMNSGPISVWNVAKAKCLQNAVRIERGLSETADVVIVRNTRVVILSDRGFSSASESSRPVFQTVFIYDLREKKYLKKLTGCYITPCPAHEYVMLDNENLLGLSDNRNHFVVWSLVNGHMVRRIKPNRELIQRAPSIDNIHHRSTTAVMTPWDRRAESQSAKQRRHELEQEMERKRLEELRKEKENGIEQFLISKNQKIAVTSYFAHHLCIFDIADEKHLHLIETPSSMLFLHIAALTPDGSYLVLPNYDEETKTSYVTMWDCQSGLVKKRLKNESNVMALAILDDGSRVIIGKGKNELHIWDPTAASGLRKIKGYPGLEFNADSKIYVTNDGTQAVVFAGDISVWDIERAAVLAVFTPDMRINCCKVAMNGQLIVFGLHDIPDLVILRLCNKDTPPLEILGEDIMGEIPDESDDDDEEDDA